jgi:hypothetical protein
MDMTKLISELNKKGVSATVIAIILLVVGLAIVIIFIIFSGQLGQASILDIVSSLNKIKHGGA